MYAGAITIIVSLLVLILAARMKPGIPTTTFTNLAGVGLSLGIVSFVYEIFLRGSVMSETLAIVGVEENISRVGLKEVLDASDIDWTAFCNWGTAFSILLANPLNWVERDWIRFVDAASTRAVTITLYLPNPGSPHIQVLADRFGFSSQDFTQQISSAHRFIEAGWSTARDEGRLKRGSGIRVRLFDDLPGYSIAVSETKAIALIPRALGSEPGDHAVALRFEEKPASFPSDWFHGQLRRLQNLPDSFANTVGS